MEEREKLKKKTQAKAKINEKEEEIREKVMRNGKRHQ